MRKKLGDIRIVSLHKVGLVGKKTCPWAKDSIDFIACVLDEDKTLQLWGVEVKSRQTVATITREKEIMRKLRRKKYEQIEAKEVSTFFHKPDERFQLLHHAYVYNFEKVILIVGDNSGKVINATIVAYNDSIRHSYGMVVDTLKTKVLNWAYNESDDVNDIMIPEKIVNLCNDMAAVNCKEALYSNVKLWKRMFSDTSILPLPTLQRLIPRSHAKWNTGKPGSDTITKIVDDCVFTPPKAYTNFESKASGRSFSNLTTAILRLYQISTAKKDFSKNYPTLTHYRDAASHRCTHKKLLRIIHRIFKKEVVETLSDKQQPSSSVTNNNDRRVTCVRFKDRTVGNRISYIPSRTFHTPARNKRKIIQEGRCATEVQHRTDHCSGFPFEVVDQGLGTKDQRKKCLICESKTKWMCVKCRLYFCMDYKETSKREEGLVYAKEQKKKNSSETIIKIYGRTCFHVGHDPALREAVKCQVIPGAADQSNKENENPNLTNITNVRSI